MTNITVYDIEAEQLDRKADELDTTIAEIVEQLVTNFLEEVE